MLQFAAMLSHSWIQSQQILHFVIHMDLERNLSAVVLIHTQTRLLEVRLIVTSPLSSHFPSHLPPCFPPRAPFYLFTLRHVFPSFCYVWTSSLSPAFFFIFYILLSAPSGHISRLTGARPPADALCGTKTRIFSYLTRTEGGNIMK